MKKYRMTAKGKRTLTAVVIMLASGSVLAIYFMNGLLVALVAIFTLSTMGLVYELYSGYKTLMRHKELKERMKQTLQVDHLEKIETPNEKENLNLDKVESNEEPDDLVTTTDIKQQKNKVKAFRPFEDLDTDSYTNEIEESDTIVSDHEVEVKEEIKEESNNKSADRNFSNLINSIDNKMTHWLHDLKFEQSDKTSVYLDYLVITDKGLMVINDMTDYKVISGNSESEKWNCFKTDDDYKNKQAISIENPSKELEKAVESIKQILSEFDLLLPIYNVYVTQDQCELYVTNSDISKAVELNKYTDYLKSKNSISDITDEMIGIIKEIFIVKNEMAREI